MDLDQLYKSMETDIPMFARVVCKDIATQTIAPFHKEIWKLFQEKKRVVVAAPRGFGKTSCLKIVTLHSALYKKSKDITFISSSEGLAIEVLRHIKNEIETNSTIRKIFGDLVSEKWTEGHLILKHSDGTLVNIRGRGAEAAIRGWRPHTLILDDLQDDESVLSSDRRRKLKNWLFSACINTLLPEGQLIVVGTVIHPLCLLNDLLNDNSLEWEKRRYMAYKDGIEKEGNELWEARPHSFLQQRKAEIGSLAFASEFCNTPIGSENAVINPEQIRYWTEIPKTWNGVIAVDPSYSLNDQSDWACATLVAVDPMNSRYLLKYIRTHSPIGEFIDSVLNLYLSHRNKITAVGVPSQGVERAFYDAFVQKVNARVSGIPVVELRNSFTDASGRSIRNKHKRITAALQPIFERGQYFIHADHEEVKDELLSIGFSRHDDLVDCLAYSENLIQPFFVDVAEEREIDFSTRYGTRPVRCSTDDEQQTAQDYWGEE